MSLRTAGVVAAGFVLLSGLTIPVVTIARTADQEKKPAKEQAAKEEDDKLTAEERKEYEQKGCGPATKHQVDTDKKTHPTPDPPADKALLYVVRPTMMGNKIQTKLAVDGKWMGVNRGNNYFFFTLDPGEHYFCSTAENKSVLKLSVAAGQTYFLQQKIRAGFMKASNRLELIDEAEGKVALGKTHPSTSKEKQ